MPREVDGVVLDYTEISKPVISYELYNPADEEVEFMYNGELYRIPPHDVHWEGRHPGNGQLFRYPESGIRPLWGTRWVTALDILRHAVGDDGLAGAVGGCGIRALFGDKRDDYVKKDARIAWVESKRAQCLAITRAHETAVRLAGEEQTERPIPSKRVRDAYKFLAQDSQDASRAYVCAVCNWGFALERELDLHAVTVHPHTDLGQKARGKLEMTGKHENSPAPSMVPKDGRGVPVGELRLDGLLSPAPAAVAISADGSGVQEERDLDALSPMRAGYSAPAGQP